MVEIVSWIMVGIVALFALVGFVGVVGTSVLSGVRRVSARHSPDRSRLQNAVRAG